MRVQRRRRSSNYSAPAVARSPSNKFCENDADIVQIMYNSS